MSAKALSTAAELRDDLARRWTTVSAVQFDTDGLPYITCTQGTLVAGQQQMLIKVADIAPLGTNAIGQAQPSYGVPIQIQVVMEASATAGVALLTEANKILGLGPVNHRGERVQIWLSANGAAPTTTTLQTGTNLKATFDPDQKYKTMLGA